MLTGTQGWVGYGGEKKNLYPLPAKESRVLNPQFSLYTD
jgi:hypothetical protein